MLFYEIEPFGTDVELLGHSITSSTIANVNRDPKKQKKPFTAEDFMPTFGRQQEPEPDPEANSRRMLAQVERLNAAFGGIDKRSKN